MCRFSSSRQPPLDHEFPDSSDGRISVDNPSRPEPHRADIDKSQAEFHNASNRIAGQCGTTGRRVRQVLAAAGIHFNPSIAALAQFDGEGAA